jgi:hypothetical protein
VLFVEIDKGAAISAGELTGELAFIDGVRAVTWCPVVLLCSHYFLYLLGRRVRK